MTRLALTIIGLTGLLAMQASADPQLVNVGGQLPDLLMRGLNGPSASLGRYRGKPLIINVWASWCGPCRAEMDSLEQLAWVDGMDAVNIIGISTDDYANRANAFLNSRNTVLRHYIDEALVLEKHSEPKESP